MFRVKESESIQGFSLVEWVLRLALLLAFAISSCSAYLLLQEQRRLAAWLDGQESAPTTALVSVRWYIGLQFVSVVVVSAILVLCLLAVGWLRRRYLSGQQSLRQLKMLAHDILTSMDRGVVTTDGQGAITSINSAGIRLLGVGFECVGRPLSCISHSNVPLVQVHREVVAGQSPVRDRDYTVEQSGCVLRLRVDGHVLKDREETALGCVIHLQDVTERVLLEERMRRMERLLSLGTLATGLHHEIKNPLTALSIHIQLLEENLSNGREGEDVDELVSVLKTEVCRLNGVLESFRSFAHLQHLSLQPTDGLSVVEKAIRLIRPQAAAQRVQITLLHSEREFPPVALDAEKFEQAVLNLVINALEAMPKGGTLTISATVVDGEFRVSVKDSGPGIPPEVRRHLFQPYFSTKTKGSGMGLALSEKLINQHGGQIDYHTGPDGTTFDIAIPLQARNCKS
jgi:PAS domain S-box-containing protein